MVVVFHYYVDGLIWRMRDDPKLRDLLKPEPAAADARPQPTDPRPLA
jgi:hypothetical protein